MAPRQKGIDRSLQSEEVVEGEGGSVPSSRLGLAQTTAPRFRLQHRNKCMCPNKMTVYCHHHHPRPHPHPHGHPAANQRQGIQPSITAAAALANRGTTLSQCVLTDPIRISSIPPPHPDLQATSPPPHLRTHPHAAAAAAQLTAVSNSR